MNESTQSASSEAASVSTNTNECTNSNWFFIICTTNSKQSIDFAIISHFNFEIEIKSLNETQRRLFFEEELKKFNSIQFSQNELDDLVKKTTGFYYGEMQSLFDYIKQELKYQMKTSDVGGDGSSGDNFLEIFLNCFKNFSTKRKFQQENKLNIETVKWTDVGGLTDIKQIITDTILLPLNYPKLFSSNEKQLGITRSGILLYGPPGTGKTLLAKAISNECELNFLSVKGPELLDMYVGQTEQNVRNLFEKARLNAPCVLFFDELDSLAPVRGRAGDSGGVMDRVVSQLLTEIDGMDKFSSSLGKSTQIFLIGATNRPDLIDPSLLRPGRFDKLIYVPIAQSFDERINILKALLRKLPTDQKFNVENFIQKCPSSLSGADFYSITNRARQNAIKRLISHCETNNLSLNDLDDAQMALTEQDFEKSILDFQPTLNESTLSDYEKYFKNYLNKS